MNTPLDPRVRMRDALRELVSESPTRFDKPSLFVLRNRLLDRTGSDARPLAEFLIEASRRGWRDRLPTGALPASGFDAMVAPFVLQWSTERFVQPEMARWAVESWAYALRVIDESQLRIAPPPKRESVAALASRLNARAAAAGAQTAQQARAVGTAISSGPAAGTRIRGGVTPAPQAIAAAAAQRLAGARGRLQPPPGLPRYATAYTGRPRATGGSVPPWIPKALFGTICAMLLLLVGRVAFVNLTAAPRVDAAAAGATAVAPVASAVAPTNAAVQRTAADSARPLVSTADVPGAPVIGQAVVSRPMAEGAPPAAAATVSAQTVSPALTGGVTIVAPERPGVPSITRGLLSTGADSARMVFVQPARRAAGDGRRMQSPSSATPITFDEIHFVDGREMQGRVDVVRAGSVIFRDMRTGLRHEYRKDDIAEIITEFGTVVRFRSEGAPAASPTGPAPRAKAEARSARTKASAGVRGKGVAGRYRIRYAAASAVGSPECTQVWTRAPNAEDIAVVTHNPGADTLAVAFQGGDVFPSTVDPDGYFASTFRIVPDQARTMTALTTRLTGRFAPDGLLQVTVNIVFYRRLRVGELTCNVTVRAEGRRG